MTADSLGPRQFTSSDLERLEAIAKGTYVAPPKAPFDLASDALYGGVSGLKLPAEKFQVMPGLCLSSTFAHINASFVMAFAPPERPNAPHPGPWASIHGKGLTIFTEIRLEAECAPLKFDRLNTLWFVIALLRLRLAQPIQMPVLTDRPLAEVPLDVERSNLIPVELELARPNTAPRRNAELSDLGWIAQYIAAADRLMREVSFNRALQTFDQAVAIANAGAGIVIAWAAIETLLRPGSHRITDRLSRALAAYLYPPGASRDRAFGEIVKCYETRGGAAHAGRRPEASQFQTAFRLARSTLIKSIELGEMPDIALLLERWRARD